MLTYLVVAAILQSRTDPLLGSWDYTALDAGGKAVVTGTIAIERKLKPAEFDVKSLFSPKAAPYRATRNLRLLVPNAPHSPEAGRWTFRVERLGTKIYSDLNRDQFNDNNTLLDGILAGGKITGRRTFGGFAATPNGTFTLSRRPKKTV